MTDRSFPEAADGRPSLPMEPELWAAGCDLETARFVARQLAAQGYTLVRVEDQDALEAYAKLMAAEVERLSYVRGTIITNAVALLGATHEEAQAYADGTSETTFVEAIVDYFEMKFATENAG